MTNSGYENFISSLSVKRIFRDTSHTDASMLLRLASRERLAGDERDRECIVYQAPVRAVRYNKGTKMFQAKPERCADLLYGIYFPVKVLLFGVYKEDSSGRVHPFGPLYEDAQNQYGFVNFFKALPLSFLMTGGEWGFRYVVEDDIMTMEDSRRNQFFAPTFIYGMIHESRRTIMPVPIDIYFTSKQSEATNLALFCHGDRSNVFTHQAGGENETSCYAPLSRKEDYDVV